MAARVFGISTLALGLAAGVAGAQEAGYRSGYVRTVEQGVTLQRASEASSEAAVPNLPFLPGDRVWTDDAGRLEIVFGDGSTLRLDSRSKLDFVSQEGGRRSERLVLRLWSGSVILHYRDDDRSPELTLETPEGAMEPREAGIYRLDVDPGRARVAVIEGEASVEAEGRTRVANGQQVLIREGQIDRGPERVDASAGDDFARWDGDLQEQLAYAGDDRYLPPEVEPYGADFASNGRWDTIPEYGNVWYPTVEIGWAPYTHGYWAWTSFGWTWVPNERWGWATSHYGRWGYGGRGWYWIPGRSWSPAWVSWSTGGDFVGWCPLGWGDRPVRGFRGPFNRDRGRAIPRGGVLSADATDRGAWTYLRRTDMGQRDVARRRVADVPQGMAEVHASPAARTRLSRDLRAVEGIDSGARPGGDRAVPRNVRTRPGMGDTVPELRGDNMTTIPHPTARRRYDSEGDKDNDTAASGRPGSGGAQRRYYPDSTAARRQGESNDAPAGDDNGRVRGGGTDRSRETVRPLFAPLSRTRPDDGTRDGSSRDDAAARQRERDSGAARDRERERERDSWTRTRPSGGDSGRSYGGDSGRDTARERPGFRSEPRPERERDGGSSSGGSSGSGSHDSGSNRDSGRSRGGSDNGGGSRGSGGGDHAQHRERPH